ncbi:MAG TPA: energy transducer TonB [Terriglobales bacterium]|jgi:TonB family protein|nr:energy transducer TonB [Terriglobales bacterium]
MANQVLISPQIASSLDNSSLHMQQLIATLEQSWWSSLKSNLRDAFFPEKLPPLKLTSKPVRVREIWGEYNNRKPATVASAIVHGFMVAGLIAISIAGARAVKQELKPQTVVDLVAPDVSVYMPISNKPHDTIGGGGGGGDRDKLQAPKGKLPKIAMEQFTPPVVVARNLNPKLPVEPTVVIPPQVKVPTVNMPSLGDPMSKVVGPPSNGTGSGGGIGTGSGGGVGSGEGPGVGPGRGGGIGGGVFKIGGGVSAPKPLYTPDPEYSEEARKAKYQGTCVLWMIVGPDGRPREVRMARGLGMGLDEKAIQAVKQWKFEPAQKDGHPVAVQMNVEVSFRLY